MWVKKARNRMKWGEQQEKLDDDVLFKQQRTLKLLGPSECGKNATFFLAVASSISSREAYRLAMLWLLS